MSSLENPTIQSYIFPFEKEARGRFIQNSNELPDEIKRERVTSSAQNRLLIQFIKKNPEFRKKWEDELARVKNGTTQGREKVISNTKKALSDIKEQNTIFPVQKAEEFLESHGLTFESAPAGMRNNNPFNIKWTGSDFQKKILIDAKGPSKNRDQGDPQVDFYSPHGGMASGLRLLLHRYHSNKLKKVKDLIANTKVGWTQDGTKANRLGNNAAIQIAERMGVDVNDTLDFKNKEVLLKFVKSLLYQEHGQSSNAYASIISPTIDKVV